MKQTRNFNFVFRLVDDLCDGDLLYYFYHKFERNKDVNFDDLEIFLDGFHDDLIGAWNDESYNNEEGHISDEWINEIYEDNFDINEIEY